MPLESQMNFPSLQKIFKAKLLIFNLALKLKLFLLAWKKS